MAAKCVVEGCYKPIRSGKCLYCEMHYGRLRRNGTLELKQVQKLEYLHSNGYVRVYVPGHRLLFTHVGNYEYKHRVVYFNQHGAGPFTCHWCSAVITWNDMHIDHVDSNKTNNDISNLVAACARCNQSRGIPKMRKTMNDRYATRLTFNGETQSARTWAERLGITTQSLKWRIEHKWDAERIYTERRGNFGPQQKVKQKYRTCMY